MPKLSPAQVRHIAKLARLRLSDSEVDTFATELTAILGYIDQLSTVDTKGVEATENVTGQANSFREDEIRTDNPTREELLSTSPLPIREDQIQTPSAHG
ncbi:Asp-tRNA(Asn)/Glu-tRNA(Gln) amidotransferase subunit GatC [Candidatus Peregrinibacteria bacterium]|nr:Asp-tRNA(Asn)/Glu-tRNA(Gln) amidotransferase subunit GatC [Candidatus Peregrinibacteria bacterium]